MSRANIEKFYEIAQSDSRLARTLLNGTESDNEAIERAVDAAKIHGLDFTHDEMKDWVAEQRSSNELGELNDLQLEYVAGGKEDKDPPPS